MRRAVAQAERLANGTIKVTLREFVDSAGLQRSVVDNTVAPWPEIVESTAPALAMAWVNTADRVLIT